MTTTYHGHRNRQGVARAWVSSNGRARPLPMRLNLFSHSPGGFEWGYSGSGPAQLALAILADATRNDELAVHLHQVFKFERIAGLDRDADWTITREEVLAFVARHPPIEITIPTGDDQ